MAQWCQRLIMVLRRLPGTTAMMAGGHTMPIMAPPMTAAARKSAVVALKGMVIIPMAVVVTATIINDLTALVMY
jgi:hypothetical protein